MKRETAREELLRNAIPGGLTEEDALLWMALLHTHEIHLRPGSLDDGGGQEGQILPADTQRGAAAVIAALWGERSDGRRTSYVYWYGEYNRRTPYEDFSDIPGPDQERIQLFRDALTRDKRVLAAGSENEKEGM